MRVTVTIVASGVSQAGPRRARRNDRYAPIDARMHTGSRKRIIYPVRGKERGPVTEAMTVISRFVPLNGSFHGSR